MLKKLRIKIVASIMAVGCALLLLAFVAVMAVTFNSSLAPLQRELANALASGPGGSVTFVIGNRSLTFAQRDGSRTDSLIPAAVAVFDDDGGLIAFNDVFATSMDADTRGRAVETAATSKNDSGLLVDDGILFGRGIDTQGHLVLAFVDASGLMASMRGTALGTLGVLVLTMLALLAVSLLLARVITRPVQKAWDAQARFVADASHELKTPLTVVLANADILAARPERLDPDQRKWLAGIRSEAQRMKGLVEEMLFLARGEAAPRGAGENSGKFDLSSLVRQACLSFDAVAFEAGVELADDIEDGLTARGDAEQVERLVKTLVDNAVKYAGVGGRATVRLAAGKHGRAVFSTTNTGEPIPADELPHVFDRFWRSDAARTASGKGGYGLGLAIARSIAEEQGATIAVASSPEKGTVFTVVFPAG